MTTIQAVLERGREAFEGRRWADAYSDLSEGDRGDPLPIDDLERMAFSAFLIGRDEDCVNISVRAYGECLRLGDTSRAVRCAFWVSFLLLNRAELAPASGWLSRARRLLDDQGEDCVEEGYLLLPDGLRILAEGDATTGYATFASAYEIGKRFKDHDLMTMAQHGQGQALIMLAPR